MSSQSLAGIFETSCKKYHAKTALVTRLRYRSIAWTYGDLFNFARGTAALLRENNIQKGDRILLWSRNSPYWVGAYFGILMAGGVVVPLHKENTIEFIEKVAKETEAKILLSQTGLKLTKRLQLKTIPLEIIEPATTGIFSESLKPEDTALLMYTSGTTGEPKGVVLTHQNIAGNLFALIEAAKKENLFGSADRYLSILPLSHMFEQQVGMLFPLASGSQIIYPPNLASATILSYLQKHKITRIVAVPEFLKRIIERVESGHAINFLTAFLIRRKFGGRFQFIVCGGAPLEPGIEKKCGELGIKVLQGYGLTETSPIVSTNTILIHRFASCGKPLEGVKVKIARDGEILVKGPGVFSGYFKDEEKTKKAFNNEGWFLTDDIGEIDKDGFLYIRGRKKYMIKGPAGQNVFPEDIEFELNKQSGVRDSAVVGLEKFGRVEIHAVLLLDAGAELKEIIENTNKKLASFQQINNFSVWPEEDFPRSATQKVRKKEVLKWLAVRAGAGRKEELPPAHYDPLIKLLAEVSGANPREIGDRTKIIPELNLDSISRIELVSRIEEDFNVALDETKITSGTTAEELKEMISKGGDGKLMKFKNWPLLSPVKILRAFVFHAVIFSFLRLFMKIKVSGLENIENIKSPIIFMSNHLSYLDSPIILYALPKKFRLNLAISAAVDVLYREYRRWVFLATLIFNPFPFPRKEGEPIMQGMEFTGEMLDRGCSVLFFPEGKMSESGKLLPLKGGAGLMAVEMREPIVPVIIKGINEILSTAHFIPHRRGIVKITFGKPLKFKLSDSYAEATHEIGKALENLISK